MRASTRSVLPATALLAVALAVPALAQQPAGPSKYPECPANFQANGSDQEAAKGAYKAGKRFFDEGDYAKAIDYFKDAYRLDCSATPLLQYIGRAYESAGDKAEAIAAFELYVQRSPKADDVEPVRRKVEKLKAALAQPAASAAPATSSAAATPASATPSASAGAGQGDPPKAAGSLTPWIVTGAGGAALVGGVVMFAVGAGKVSDSKALCNNGVCASQAITDQASSLNKSGYTLETVGAIVGAAGLVAAAGGLYWHFRAADGAKKAQLVPVFGPSFAGAAVGGSF